MATVHTFSWLPDEHDEFVRYLAVSPDIWARASGELGTSSPSPAPVAEYFARHRDADVAGFDRGVYLGLREAVLNPPISEHERVDGGTAVPFAQAGEAVPDVSTIFGGTPVKFQTVHFMGAELIDYIPGGPRTPGSVAQSNLCYYADFVRGNQFVKKSDPFLAWAKRVVGWVRRRTTAVVPVVGLAVPMKCTPRVAAAHAAGTLVVHY